MLEAIAAALAAYTVVLEPDHDEPEWWAGAPSACRGPDGAIYLAARMREAHSPRGRRGYEIRILRSEDGVRYEPIHRLTREAAGVPGFERPALLYDAAAGRYRLYGCAGLERGWAILRWDDADHPSRFDARSAHPVLWADYADDGFVHVTGYKDPFVWHDGSRWRMMVIGTDRVERPWHFASADGEVWQAAASRPLLPSAGWHDYFTRPACVLPLPIGYLLVYEGSQLGWRDPVYNIATGLAYSPDLVAFHDLTPEAPLLASTTPGDYATWRYSHWLPVGDRVYVYYEAARPNNSNEVRLGVLDPAALRAMTASPISPTGGRT